MPRSKPSPEFLAHCFKPGQSGNPKGRRKGAQTFETVVARILGEKIPGSDLTKREALARVFVDMLLKRDGRMIREYLARAWPATQKIEGTLETISTEKTPFRTASEHKDKLRELLEVPDDATLQ